LLPSQERVMLELRDAIENDPLDFIKLGWQDEDVCEWDGVTCAQFSQEHQVVTVLNIGEKQLHGRVPESMWMLTNLQALYMQGNKFRGQVPDFGSWMRVKGLYFQDNKFTGTLPATVGHMKELQAFNVRSNTLAGTLPTGWEKLTKLKELDTGFNPGLVGTMPDLSKLRNLVWLRMNGCQLTGTIGSVAKLKNLKVMRLGQNMLNGTLPDFTKKLTSLLELNLAYNTLSGTLPNNVGELSNLKSLDLAGNSFRGTIPTTLGSLDNLDWLKLSENLLTGTIPTELGHLKQAQAIYVDRNRLHGPIPTEMGDLPRLAEFSVQFNQDICGEELKIRRVNTLASSTGTSIGRMCNVKKNPTTHHTRHTDL